VRPGRAALALDLMEEFRAFADRLVLSLINRGQIGARMILLSAKAAPCCLKAMRASGGGRLSGAQAGKPDPSAAQRTRPVSACCRTFRPVCWRARCAATPPNICPIWCAEIMLVIVCYDVNTETREGRRRLRRVAKGLRKHGAAGTEIGLRMPGRPGPQFEALERELVAEIKAR
jgi:hypothetical protein